MKKMRVLHVYRTYFPDPPGGLQEAIRQICASTAKRGVENTIFTLSPHPEPSALTMPEAKVVRARSWWAPASCDLGGPQAWWRFRSLLKQSDVVVYHFPWPYADLLHLTAASRVPAVLLYHSDIVRQRWLGRVYGPLMRHTLNAMSAVVATSPAYAQTSPVLASPNVRDKVRVIPLGIDEASYTAQPDERIFERLVMDGNEPYFLFIGVLRYYKGLHILLEAARRVSARIVIAGSGPESEALKHQSNLLRTTNVIFAGQVSDSEKVALIRRCRALVLPSHLRSEAFGVVLIEAAMYGRPMISCEIGTGTSYVNQNEQTGLVVPPEDPEALASAMQRLISSPELSDSFGRAARQRYEQLYSDDALGEAYISLFGTLVETGACATR
jgi:glycosyltransferase involved in cell wall biosynthesis